jgi:FtsZ-binding cell division protein ZapB
MESLKEKVSQLQREVNTAVTRSKAPETERTHTRERPAAARDTLIPVPGKIVEQEITE